MEPLFEGFGGEGRDGALRWHACEFPGDVAEERELRREIHEPGNIRGEPRQKADVAEGIGVQWTETAFVIMREKLGLVGGNVDADGTIALAPLAGEAEIERALDFAAAPAIADDCIFTIGVLGHLP